MAKPTITGKKVFEVRVLEKNERRKLYSSDKFEFVEESNDYLVIAPSAAQAIKKVSAIGEVEQVRRMREKLIE